MRNLLKALAAEGRTIFVSSHLMSEMALTAEHLIVIGRGRLIADTSVKELLATASGDRVRLRTPHRSEAMTVLANAGATVAVIGTEELTVTGPSAERIAALLTEAGLAFTELTPHRASLEEAYMELTRDSVEYTSNPGEPS
jgi:ABC-2 type transport system ATP-binding protein